MMAIKDMNRGIFLQENDTRKKSGDKMKNLRCNICKISIQYLSEPQQKIHEQNHISEKNNQENLKSYF